MYPELFHIGPIPVRSYGVMLALSFVLGVIYIERTARRDKRPFETFLSIAYIMIIGGVLGARLFYVLFHLDEFVGNWFSTINPFASDEYGIAGLNMYGGIIVAIVATYVYCRFRGLSVLDVFDRFAPTVGIGLAVTRIGCFLNGCCFGTPTDLPWGVQFPEGSLPHHVYGDAFIHPAQLYSSFYGLVIFILLHFMLKRRAFAGQVIAMLFMVEAVFRYLIEYVRYYENAMRFNLLGMEPTYNQVMSIALFLLGLIIYLVRRKSSTAGT